MLFDNLKLSFINQNTIIVYMIQYVQIDDIAMCICLNLATDLEKYSI